LSVGARPSSSFLLQERELLHVLRLPDFDRADRIGEFWGSPQSRAFAELLIDCEEDRMLRAVLVGMLRGTPRFLPVAGGRRVRAARQAAFQSSDT
jgi:ParB-like chromosome segregation protein Spo0J